MNLWEIKPDESSRRFTTFQPETGQKTVTVHPGETVVLADGRGPGILNHLWFTVTGWFYEHWNPTHASDTGILKQLILRIYWDGSDVPSVQSPLGDFFGAGQCEYAPFSSKYLSLTSGGFNCYFPMPFESVRLTLTNLHESLASEVFMNADYTLLPELPEHCGRFHCRHSTGRREGSEAMRILETAGSGQYVGCALSMQGSRRNYLSFLEAPEYFFVDGSRKAQIVGTGLEDYFGGGWYFREGEFSAETNGVPLKDPLNAMVSMYRFHATDPVRFSSGLVMEFRNPWSADRLLPYWYSSTVYYYLDRPDQTPPQEYTVAELMSQYTRRDRDHVSIP